MRGFTSFVLISTLTGCSLGSTDGSAIRVTLDDDQVIVGEVHTAILRLDGALGELAIPLPDVGEVRPVEGVDLDASNGHVTVWLRNGTELRGRWTDPELDVAIAVGGQDVSIALPMDQMFRFQTPGTSTWPNTDVFRVKTTHGDDLLVDPEQTQFTITNTMGTFSPFLSECLSVAPIGDPTGDWRVELVSGTVLVGPLADTAITLAMPMGPDEVRVPIANITTMTWQSWGTYDNYSGYDNATPAQSGWFQNGALERAKRTH